MCMVMCEIIQCAGSAILQTTFVISKNILCTILTYLVIHLCFYVFYRCSLIPWRWSRRVETYFFVIKPTIYTNFTNLFCHETPHVSVSSSVHHQEFIHCKLNNGICHTPLLSLQWINSWWWTYELAETCRFSWQNKFVKLVYIVGFITKKYISTLLDHLQGITEHR